MQKQNDGIQLRHIHVIDPEQKQNGGEEAYVNKAFDSDEQIKQGYVDERQTNDEDEFVGNPVTTVIYQTQQLAKTFYADNRDIVWYTIGVILLLLYFLYFGYCMYFAAINDLFSNEQTWRLIVLTVLFVAGISLSLFFKFVKPDLSDLWRGWDRFIDRFGLLIHIILIIIAIGGNIAVIIVEVILKEVENLISFSGIVVFVVVFYLTSHNPARVNWRPVFWGLEIQFYFALMILRWDVGNDIFQWCGDRVTEFLTHSDAGSKFLFGDPAYQMHFFAFAVLPVIIFFSTAISILYYLGVMQFVIRYIARGLAFALGTSPAESLNAAGNIFIGQSEAPLMIRPFIEKLTNSELHAIMTGGFATIAGSVLAAYVSIGVPAKHLLSASVMSAPAALAMAKLSYPETKATKAMASDVYKMEKGTERNLVEAASNGASQSIKLVANIAVNLIAFISLLAFVNATLTWFGMRAGREPPDHEYITFEFICSYVFWPVAFVMGVQKVDCRIVGELIGIKTFINEFVAYNALSVYIDNKKNLTWYTNLAINSTEFTGAYTTLPNKDIVYADFNHTLKGGLLQDRSEVIATYALCGFSNVGSIGVMLGALGAMAPCRRSDLSKIVIRAMICGNVACFLTACISGLLYIPEF